MRPSALTQPLIPPNAYPRGHPFVPDGSTRLRPWFGGALEFHVTEMEEQAVAWSVGRAAEEAPIRAAIGLEDQRSGPLLARAEQHQRLRLLEITRHRMEVVVGQAIDMLNPYAFFQLHR